MSDSEYSDESSEYSETDYGSSEDEVAPAPAHGAPSQLGAPRLEDQTGMGPSVARPPVPRLGVPSLGLPARQHGPGDGPPATSRGPSVPAIPSLQLQLPQAGQHGQSLASARPHLGQQAESSTAASMRAPGPRAMDAAVPGGCVEPAGGRTAVQLVSFAFWLEQPVGSADASHGAVGVPHALAAIRDNCVKTLGVAAEELKFFELHELSSDTASSGCTSVGVAVNNSSFSLAALETLMAENKRLTSAAERSSAGLESLGNLVREQHQTVHKAQLLAAEKEAETRRLHDRCRYLEKEVVALRQQLHRSDTLRMQGQMALDELKGEFESLMHNILAENSGFQDTLSETISLPQNSDADLQANRGVTGVMSAP